MAGLVCTSSAPRRSLFFSPSSGLVASLSSTRPDGRPMAIPTDGASTVFAPLNLLILALCVLLGAATASRQEQLWTITRAAAAGLAPHEVTLSESVDAADLPAMDPTIARVIDPRPAAGAWPKDRPRGTAIEPFQYEVQGEQSLAEVALRWGISLSTLLWNNGLAGGEDYQAGQKLTVLPVGGLLHRVEAGETAQAIAERYGIALTELIRANALDDPNLLAAGRMLVVPGASAPMVAAAQEVGNRLSELAVEATVSSTDDEVRPMAAPVRPLSHAERVEAAMADPDRSLPMPPNATPAQREFIRSIVGGARESQRITGIPASVTLAQAILESDWGRSRLSREAKNLFGIKAHNRPGSAGVYNIATWEVLSGVDVTVVDAFRAYKTFADSIVDHGRWFHTQPRYANALAVRDDPRAFARAINAAGYATDPAYASKLIALMDRFDLYDYDVAEEAATEGAG